MRKTLLNIVLMSLIVMISVAQTNDANRDVFNDVRLAIKTGSSKELAKHLNSRIELVIQGDQSSYSKTQAEFVLKDFFKKHPPNSFEYIHKGSSKDGLMYAIGKYSYNGGSFRVVLRSKKFGGENKIYNLDFTED